MDTNDSKPTSKDSQTSFPSELTTDLNDLRDKIIKNDALQEQPQEIDINSVKERLKKLGHEQPVISDDYISSRLQELNKAAEETKPYHNEVLLKVFNEVKTTLHLPENPAVLYPGSSVDTTVAESFGKENVLHLDLNTESIKILLGEGYRAIAGDTQEITSDNQFDLVVLWNSGVTPDSILNLVKGGGYVLANNHHGSANIVATNIEFELIGGITPVNPAEVQPPEVVSEWLDEEYYEVTREGKLSPLSQEDYEAALLDTTRNVHSQAMGKDVMFIFRKLGI